MADEETWLESRTCSGPLHMQLSVPAPLSSRPHQALPRRLGKVPPDHQLKIATQTFTICLPLDGQLQGAGTVLPSALPRHLEHRLGRAVLQKHLWEAPASRPPKVTEVGLKAPSPPASEPSPFPHPSITTPDSRAEECTPEQEMLQGAFPSLVPWKPL